jgi:hypothetical protein
MTSQLYKKADGRLAPSILAERGSRAYRDRLRSWILFTTQWGGLHNTNGTMGQAMPRTVPLQKRLKKFLLLSCRGPDRYAQVHARPPSTLQQSDWNIFRGLTLVKSRADRVPGHSRELRHASLRAGHVTLHAISEHSTLLRCLYVLFYPITQRQMYRDATKKNDSTDRSGSDQSQHHRPVAAWSRR